MNSFVTSLFGILVSLSSSTIAELVFSESFTGAELHSDSRVSFPSRTPSLSGSSLMFDTGTEFSEKLFELSLLPADSLNLFHPVVVDISMNLTVTQADHDPGAAIGDGIRMFGFLAPKL